MNGVEAKYFLMICLNIRTHLHSQGSHVLLLKLSSQMTLDKGGLASASIPHQHQLESGHILTGSHDFI